MNWENGSKGGRWKIEPSGRNVAVVLYRKPGEFSATFRVVMASSPDRAGAEVRRNALVICYGEEGERLSLDFLKRLGAEVDEVPEAYD